MIGKIAKMYAYTKAPKATFVALHPLRTLKLLRNGLIALPLGIWLGKKVLEGERSPQANRP